MIRIILALITGYLTMAVSITLVFCMVFIAPDFAFQPGTRDVTMGWMVYTLVASFIAAMLGTWVAMWIARRLSTGIVLAWLIVILGIASAYGNAMRQREIRPPYSPTETIMERASNAVQPTVYALLAPVVGAAGSILSVVLSRPVAKDRTSQP